MRDLNLLYPPLLEKANQLQALSALLGLPLRITDTLRTQAEQTALYAQGRTAAGSIVTNCQYPQSPHCWGLAFDFCKDEKGREYDDSDRFFEKIGALGKLLGLFWGGDFRSFEDKPHLEFAPLLPQNSVKTLRITYGSPDHFLREWNEASETTYEYRSSIHFLRIPIKRFKLRLWDRSKRTTAIKNYANGGFFGGYDEKGVHFTLPAANLVADIGDLNALPLHYLREWGKIENGKAFVDCTSTKEKTFRGKAVSTLLITENGAEIVRCKALPKNVRYAVSGIPVILDGKDVSFQSDVLPQGWDAGSLYATWHSFLAIDGDHIVYMALKTKSENCIASSEVYQKLKKYGFRDVIKLDGGGSFLLDVDGKNKAATAGSRQINNVLLF